MPSKKALLIFLLLIFAVITRLPFMNREFVLEEALNVKDGQAIAKTGYPQVYAGEQAPEYIHLDRTPGLFFFLAASFKIFSQSEISARLVPLAFNIGTILLIFYYTNRIFKNKKRFVPIFSCFLFAFHPFIIQNSLHIHYDGAVLSFFTTLYLLMSLEKITTKKNRLVDHANLALVVFFGLFVKYDPILMAVAISAIFAYFFYKPFLPKILILTGFAICSFLVTYYLYNLYFAHPEGFWLSFIWIKTVLIQKLDIERFTFGQESRTLWAQNYFLLIRFAGWLSVPTILLSIYCAIRLIKTRTLRTDPKIIFLILWFSFYCLVYLSLGWAGDFPRYFAPAMPPLFILIATVTTLDFIQLKSELNGSTIGLSIILASCIIFLLEKANYLFLDRITGWTPYIQTSFFGLILLGGLSIILTLINRSKKIILTSLLVLLSVNFFQMAAQYLHDIKSNYSLTNFYGYGGYRESGNFLKNEIRDKEAIILTFDPVAYYWQGKYLDFNLFGPYYSRDSSIIINYLKEDKIDAIALPNLYSDELAQLVKSNGIDYEKLRKEKFPNMRNFGGTKGIDVYYPN